MTTPGIDYAWQHPDPAAIAAAGYTFACRYVSRDPTKNITLAEAQSLAAHGIWVVANWEYGAQDMLRGYAGGIADAQLALAQAKAAGMPPGRPIYFSADWAVTAAQMPAVLAYLSGAASVLGSAQTGEYGGYAAVKAARDSGTVWTWQTSAWSGGAWDARDTIRQTGSATVGGVQVDVNEAMAEDFGQWIPGDDMTPDESNKLTNVYDGFFFGGSSCGLTPPGAANNSEVSKLDYLIKAVGALSQPQVDPGALALAVKGALQDPAVLKDLAHALAVETHNNTPPA